MKERIKAIFRKLRSFPRWVWIILAIVLLGGFFLLRPKGNQTPLQYYTVKKQDIKVSVSASGILTGKNTADLRFPASGPLAFLNVKTGDTVKKGEILAGLDTVTLAASLQKDQNLLAADQAALDKIYDDIHLFQYGNGGFSNVGTANETQTQRAARIAAEKARDNDTDTVKAAQDALNHAILISPLDGTVTLAGFIPGQNVLASDTIVEVVDFSNEVFSADIDESDISKIALGQTANFTLNAYGDQNFSGTVSNISSIIHTTSSGSTVVTTQISFDNPQVKQIAGLNGQVDITTNQKSNVLTVPLSALKDNNTVIVQNGKNLAVKNVTPGLKNDTDVEITSGLNEGDIVVTNPSAAKLK